MKYVQLGPSALKVSEICLGTMTWGQQNTAQEAHAQLDYAFAQGVNFIDTAEMYSVPPRAETQGSTEAIIGPWLKRQQRDKVIVATKVAGGGRPLMYLRGEQPRVTRKHINMAIDASLQRLQTDYVDLYQIHWPDRYVPQFGAWSFDLKQEREAEPIQAQLEAFADVVKAGKIRYLGVSNETPWGVMEFVRVAQQHNLPRIVSIQNAYNLLNRVFEYGLSEVCFRENVALLPYSPLGFGHLSGKYVADPKAQGRATLFEGFAQRYTKPNVPQAVSEYVKLAAKLGVAPAALAQAFVKSRFFVASTIIGATSLQQLQENIRAFDIELSEEALREIDAIHLRYTNPAP